MQGDKLFGTTLFGFDKNDVNAYIEKVVKEFETKLREKDEELNLLRLQNKDLKERYQELSQHSQVVVSDKNKILEVLLKAQEKADTILEEARQKAELENIQTEELLSKRKMEVFAAITLEEQKMRILKDILFRMKEEAATVLENFIHDLDQIVLEEASAINLNK